MYDIADKMITGCKFDFAILTLQIPIACFDMAGHKMLEHASLLCLRFVETVFKCDHVIRSKEKVIFK